MSDAIKIESVDEMTMHKATTAIADILKTGKSDEVIMKALETLEKIASPTINIIGNEIKHFDGIMSGE